MTQKQLAVELNISNASISHYETGTRTPPTKIASKLAEYFNVSLDYLLETSHVFQPSENQKRVFSAVADLDLCNMTFTDVSELIEVLKKHADELNERRSRAYGKI